MYLGTSWKIHVITFWYVSTYNVKDEAAVRKKTDAPSPASADGIDNDSDTSISTNRGSKASASSAAEAGASHRRGRGKSSLNAHVVSLLLSSCLACINSVFSCFCVPWITNEYWICLWSLKCACCFLSSTSKYELYLIVSECIIR